MTLSEWLFKNNLTQAAFLERLNAGSNNYSPQNVSWWVTKGWHIGEVEGRLSVYNPDDIKDVEVVKTGRRK